MLHCAPFHYNLLCLKTLINELLEYKGLMLIPMAGVIVSRLSSNSFEELLRPEKRLHLRCEALLL